MGNNKNKAPKTLQSSRGNNNSDKNKSKKIEKTIDRLDLEKDFLSLTARGEHPFPIHIFPDVIQEIIIEGNDKYQFVWDYMGAGILSAASAAIGNSFHVQVKKGWTEKCNLYLVIVGRPGDSKSHALDFCFRPIHEIEKRNFAIYEKAMEEYERNSEENSNSSKKPQLKKFLISDFTPEALIKIHSNNRRGIYIYVDELNQWLKNFNRYNNSGEDETYLTLWSGGPISIDRASGKSLRIDYPFVGVIGSTQISKLREFGKGGRDSNGFMDRLLFVYPHNKGMIKWNLKTVNDQVLENYNSIISKLIDLKYDDDYKGKIIPIEKSAKEFLFKWQNDRKSNHPIDYERSIEVKLQQYVIRFALILQLLYHASDEETRSQIELPSVKGAIKLFEYFYRNAIEVREETLGIHSEKSLSVTQKEILDDLPDKPFSTRQGIEIACKIFNGKARISKRQFQAYLQDKNLFVKIRHGLYRKRI